MVPLAVRLREKPEINGVVVNTVFSTAAEPMYCIIWFREETTEQGPDYRAASELLWDGLYTDEGYEEEELESDPE